MSETKRPKKLPKKSMVDVQEPGKAAPSATSKPVIVTNRPLLKDPMVVEQTDETNDDSREKAPKDTPVKLSVADKPKLQPLTDSISPDEPSDQAEAPPADSTEPVAKAVESTADDGKSDELERSQSKSPESETDAGQKDVAEPGSQSPEDTSKNAADQQAQAAAAQQAEHDAAVQRLIDSKQYVLRINSSEQRKSKRFIVLGVGLSGLLVLVWIDIALDAGIIKLGGLNSVTHFFSN
jgi:hypothetical protein